MLLLALIGFALTVVLPILSFMRASRAQRVAEDLRTRLAVLDTRLDDLERRLSARDARAVAVPAAEKPAAEPPVALRPPTPAASREPQTPRAAVIEPPPPVTPVSEIPTPPVGAVPPEREGLEQLIGGRWLLYAGIAGLVLGMSYFVKYAFDNGWVSEEMRVAAAVVAGAALIAAGLRFSARGLALFGQALSGGGIVVLYVAVYAALHFYQLITRGPAFGLMVAITAGGALLAHRERAQALALLAALGGFATPLLIGGERGQQVVLFTYVGILIAFAALLVRTHGWGLLSVASYASTFVLILMWMIGSYQASAWLRTELFLAVYLGMFLYMFQVLWGRKTPSALLAQAALATAPLVFHAASLALLASHPAALLFYFLLFTVAGLAAAAATRHPILRVLTLLLAGVPLMVWTGFLDQPRWYLPALATACAIYAMQLASQWHAMSGEDRDRSVIEAVHAQLNGLLLPLTLYVFFVEHAAWWNPRMAAILAILNGSIAFLIRGKAPSLHRQYVALATTLAAVAIALQFDGPVVALGWTLEGVMLGWLAMSDRSRLFAAGSGLMIAFGALRLEVALLQPLAVGSPALFNPRAAVVVMVVAALAWLAWKMRTDPEPTVRSGLRDTVIILANLLALGWLSADINAFFTERALAAAGTPGDRDARLMQQAALSITWAAYAVAAIAIGIRRSYVPARYFAIALLGITVVKVVAFDIAELDRLYRMLSVLAVGVLLVAASYLYQRTARDPRR